MVQAEGIRTGLSSAGHQATKFAIRRSEADPKRSFGAAGTNVRFRAESGLDCFVSLTSAFSQEQICLLLDTRVILFEFIPNRVDCLVGAKIEDQVFAQGSGPILPVIG